MVNTDTGRRCIGSGPPRCRQPHPFFSGSGFARHRSLA